MIELHITISIQQILVTILFKYRRNRNVIMIGLQIRMLHSLESNDKSKSTRYLITEIVSNSKMWIFYLNNT